MQLNPFSSTDKGDRTGPSGEDDFGFGEEMSGRGISLLDKQGNFNVDRSGVSTRFAYQWLIKMRWRLFFALVLAYYIAVNLVLGTGFFLLGVEGIDGIKRGDSLAEFVQCFFFSVQTFTTVGYGNLAPVGLAHQCLATLGALIGLMSVALATGLFFARFSRPRRLIVFSERAIIAPYKNITSFQFRLANRSSSKLINVSAQVVYSWTEATESGKRKRRFFELPLERTEIAMFPLNWTVVHPISEDSPLVDSSEESISLSDGEFIVQISGFDETYARQIYAHTSYRADCLQWGKRFDAMYLPTEEGRTMLHLDRIDSVLDADMGEVQKHVSSEQLLGADNS